MVSIASTICPLSIHKDFTGFSLLRRGQPRESRVWRARPDTCSRHSNPVFPTTKYYANPFESQRSHRRMVVLALAALLLVVAPCPLRVRDGVTCPFMKTLSQKLRVGPAKMDPFLFPAPLRHRRNPRIRLHFPCLTITLSLRAKRRQQARRHHRTRSRERLKDEKIGMRCRRPLDLLV